MNLTLPGFLFLSVLALLSLPLTRRWMHPLLTLCDYMCASALSQLMLVVFLHNLHRSYIEPSLVNFWTLHLVRLVVIPSMFVWLFTIYEAGPRLPVKFIATLAGLTLFWGLDELVRRTGIVRDIQWDAYWSVLRWFGTGLVLYLIHRLIGGALRKEAIV